MTTVEEAVEAVEVTDQAPRRWRFPSAFTVLFGVTIAVWLLAFAVPSGQYQTDTDSGRPIPGSYVRADADLSFVDRTYELYMAPVNGLYGIKSTETGKIGPYETGDLYGAAGVFLFVLAIGIFITMTMTSGAIDAGIGRINARFGGRGVALIIILMILFSIGGTTEGMAEETLGFYALVVPLMLKLGYDRMVAASVILLGAGIGTLGSTINPFATGVASGAADISIGDGIGLRLAMYVVLTAITIWYVVRYARKVKDNPAASIVGFRPEDAALAAASEQTPMLSGRQLAVIWLMGATFAFMIFAIVPWAQVISGPDADSYGWQLDWYFPELAALFIVMAIVIGLVAGMGEKGMTDTIVRGAGDFVSVGLIIVLARGVTVIMNNAKITDTVLHSLESTVSGTAKGVFGPLLFLLNIPLAFLVPSSSGHAALAMPVLAPLGDFADVSRGVVVTAYQSASGWMNLFTPTSAVVMGGLAVAKVDYNRYLRFIAPLLGILLIAITAFIAIGAMLS
ncbi:MAG: YfcC family protein [Acidimicrobiales bacterium]